MSLTSTLFLNCSVTEQTVSLDGSCQLLRWWLLPSQHLQFLWEWPESNWWHLRLQRSALHIWATIPLLNKYRERESNPRPRVYDSPTLPTELSRHLLFSYLRWDSNPHEYLYSTDFESVMSTIPSLRHFGWYKYSNFEFLIFISVIAKVKNERSNYSYTYQLSFLFNTYTFNQNETYRN